MDIFLIFQIHFFSKKYFLFTLSYIIRRKSKNIFCEFFLPPTSDITRQNLTDKHSQLHYTYINITILFRSFWSNGKSLVAYIVAFTSFSCYSLLNSTHKKRKKRDKIYSFIVSRTEEKKESEWMMWRHERRHG